MKRYLNLFVAAFAMVFLAATDGYAQAQTDSQGAATQVQKAQKKSWFQRLKEIVAPEKMKKISPARPLRPRDETLRERVEGARGDVERGPLPGQRPEEEHGDIPRVDRAIGPSPEDRETAPCDPSKQDCAEESLSQERGDIDRGPEYVIVAEENCTPSARTNCIIGILRVDRAATPSPEGDDRTARACPFGMRGVACIKAVFRPPSEGDPRLVDDMEDMKKILDAIPEDPMFGPIIQKAKAEEELKEGVEAVSGGLTSGSGGSDDGGSDDGGGDDE